MYLEDWHTLSLLASEGTMAKVASRLYISQAAVSKRIAQLELCLGKTDRAGWPPDPLTPRRGSCSTGWPRVSRDEGVLADSQTLTDLTPLPIACSEHLLAGYLARSCTTIWAAIPILPSPPIHPVILARVRSGAPCAASVLAACLPAMAWEPIYCWGAFYLVEAIR